MQFSYRVSEADYKRAYRLRLNGSGSRTTKTVMFWVFILVCLLMLWAVVQKTASTTPADSAPAVTQSDTQGAAQDSTNAFRSLALHAGPFIFIAAVWAFLMIRLVRGTRRRYLKDPAMQGEFTVDITPGSLRIENTAGFVTQASWNLYAWWREGKNVILLVQKSGAHFILSMGQLSEAQRDDLRGILSSALPRR